MVKRDAYLNRLISKKENGLIKIITGIRRCGKSYLLFELYKNYLNSQGIDDSHIIQIPLDEKGFEDFRNPNKLYEYVLQKINETEKFYIFIDEIQLCYRIKKDGVDESSVPEEDRDLLYTTFYDILNDLMAKKNLDIYVTGSNSRLLSKDVATNFRDRGCEIQVYPLTFSEYYEYSGPCIVEVSTYDGEKLGKFEINPKYYEKDKIYKGAEIDTYKLQEITKNHEIITKETSNKEVTQETNVEKQKITETNL